MIGKESEFYLVIILGDKSLLSRVLLFLITNDRSQWTTYWGKFNLSEKRFKHLFQIKFCLKFSLPHCLWHSSKSYRPLELHFKRHYLIQDSSMCLWFNVLCLSFSLGRSKALFYSIESTIFNSALDSQRPTFIQLS